MPVTVSITRRDVRDLLRSQTGPVGRQVWPVAVTTMYYAKGLAPVDRGKLQRDIRMWHMPRLRRGYVIAVGNTRRIRYAHWQHEGTRAHGPRWAKAMRFRPKGRQRYIYRRWVRGIPASQYLIEALELASPWPVRRITAR